MAGIGSFLGKIGQTFAPQFARRNPMATPPFVPGTTIGTPEDEETGIISTPRSAAADIGARPTPMPSKIGESVPPRAMPSESGVGAAPSAMQTYRPDLDEDQQRLLEVSRQPTPAHPRHGKARSIGEALTGQFLGQPLSETIWDQGYQRQRQDYERNLADAARTAKIRGEAEKGAAGVSHTMATGTLAGEQAGTVRQRADTDAMKAILEAQKQGGDIGSEPITIGSRQVRFPAKKTLPETIKSYVDAGYTVDEAKKLAAGGKPSDFDKPQSVNSLEALAARIVADPGDPSTKTARLEEIRNAHNILNPEKPVIHWAEGKDGTVTAVTTTPTQVTAAGGKQGFGQIGKPQQPPLSLSSFNGGLSPEGFKRVQGLSDDLRTEPTVKNFNDIQAASSGITEAAKRGDGVGDLTMLRLFAKLTDPTTGVREEEYRTMSGAGGALNTVQTYLNGGWIQGQKLSPEMRKTFVDMAQQVMSNRQKVYQQTLDLYKKRAEAFGVDPGLVLNNLMAPPAAPTATGGLPQGGGKPLDGATARQFYQAAGGDPAKARELARQSGWKVQ